MNYSLRQLLLVSLLSASMVIWGVSAYVSYKGIRDEVANLFDAELAQSAKVLLSFVESLLREGALTTHWNLEQADKNLHLYGLRHKFTLNSEPQLWSNNNSLLLRAQKSPHFSVLGFDQANVNKRLWHVFDDLLRANTLVHKYERKIAFQVWSKKDGLLLRSESAPKFAFSNADNGFSKATLDNHFWHVFSITNTSGEIIIHVGQKQEIRDELTDEISLQMVFQFLVGLPILGIVIWVIVGVSLKPLSRLEKSLARREASYLKPLSVRKLPKEIVPMINEINNLFNQLEEAFEHERRFTADAAHELRTPLAGLLTQAQVALRTNDNDTRKQALKRIEQAVNRMTYLVQQLLLFSRIESSTEYLAKESTALAPEVIKILAELEPEARRKRISIEFTEEENAQPIIINAPLIAILIRNIVDNAIKYTPIQGNVLISIGTKPNHLQLSVEDSGPGIAPDQYENSLKRFHRCVETANKAQGTGLGFSIVERIASIHSADLVLGVSQFGGLKVSVLFTLPMRPVDKAWQKKLSFFNIRQDG